MAPARARFCPLVLLLLLGLWVAEVPVSAKPKHMTSAQWFEIQHVQPSPQACKGAMGNINKHTNHCRDLHTFLNEAFSNVAATCHTPIIACKIGQEGCHQSQKPMSLTTCELPLGRYQDRRYNDKQLDLLFIVARDPPQQKDSLTSLPVPVPWVMLPKARCFPHPKLCRLLALLLHFLP